MQVTKDAQLAANRSVLAKIFGSGGSINPSDPIREQYARERIAVSTELEATAVTVTLRTRMVTIALDDGTEKAIIDFLKGIGNEITSEIALAGIPAIVINGAQATSKLVRELTDQPTATGEPEPIIVRFQSRINRTYATRITVNGLTQCTDDDDTDFALLTASIKGLDNVAPAKLDDQGVAKMKKIKDLELVFNGSQRGTGAVQDIVISLSRKASVSGGFGTNVSAVSISSLIVELRELGPDGQPVPPTAPSTDTSGAGGAPGAAITPGTGGTPGAVDTPGTTTPGATPPAGITTPPTGAPRPTPIPQPGTDTGN